MRFPAVLGVPLSIPIAEFLDPVRDIDRRLIPQQLLSLFNTRERNGEVFWAFGMLINVGFLAQRLFDQLNNASHCNRIAMPEIECLPHRFVRLEAANQTTTYVADVGKVSTNRPVTVERNA